jgi:DNA repair photolyase
MDISMMPDFPCRDLVAVLVKYNEEGVERRLFVLPIYPMLPRIPPPSRELEELVRYCEDERIRILLGCDSNAHHTAWGSTNCNGRGEALLNF